MTITDASVRTGADNHPDVLPSLQHPADTARSVRPSPQRARPGPSAPTDAVKDERARRLRGWRRTGPPLRDADLAAADLAAQHAVRFYRSWLVVATTISIVANVAHAWLTAPGGMRIGAAIAAFVPPVFLFVQTHSVFLMIRARRFGPEFFFSLVLTVVIAWFAFRLSYATIRALVIMLGTSPESAGQWPLVIDLSIIGATVSLFVMSRRQSRAATIPVAAPAGAIDEMDADLDESAPRVQLIGVGDDLSPTERRMFWDRAASVVKERHPDISAISTRPVSQIADVLRLTHDDAMKQRSIVEITGMGAHTVRAIQRAGADVLARTDPKASALLQ